MVRQRMNPRERPKRESQHLHAGAPTAFRHPSSGTTTGRQRWLPCTVAVLTCCAAHDCDAIDRVILEVGQLSTASVQAKDATITLDVSSHDSNPAARVQLGKLHVPQTGTTYSDVDVTCIDLLIKDPSFACNRGTLAAHGGPTGQLAMNASGSYDASNGAVSISGSDLKVAGAVTRFTGKLQWGTWTLNAAGDGLDLVEAGKLAQPWFQLPPGDTLSGHVNFEVTASGQLSGKTVAHLDANTSDLNYSNQPGTTVAQNLTARFTGSATHEQGKLASDIKLQSSAGQALAGAVLLDFAKNPLSLTAHVEPDGKHVNLNRIQVHQTDLIDATGFAQIALGTGTDAVASTRAGFSTGNDAATGVRPVSDAGAASAGGAGGVNGVTIEQAHFDIQRLEFAAAYRSFLQLTLATTDFGALNVGGRAIGDIDITNDALTSVNARITNVSMADATRRLSLANANGEIHWSSATTAPRVQIPAAGNAPATPSALVTAAMVTAATATAPTADATTAAEPATSAAQPPPGPPQPSQLSWSASSLYGLIGGPVQMGFITYGSRFALTGNTRFPLFDGALVVHKLDVRNIGPDAELEFDAHLEPISMPLLSKAFGWPILNGQLAGRVPGVSYRNHVLTVQGDLSANVFDGTIVGSRFKLNDPLGPWPRLDADVTARHLDLDMLTHTFSIGSITGRLDADIKGLELFNWSPVAFDARLQTTPGDKSEHRISQRAVTSISSVGGGGGGVTAALQSGVLKFFKTFHYDRIGISCQLRDEVCLMNGLEPAKGGYYLVKGRGLPRIDIIGNAGRVDWTQLVSQISASMHSQNITVR